VGVRWVRLVVGAFQDGRGARYGVVAVGPSGTVLRVWSGGRRDPDPAAAAMQAVLEGMWQTRRLGRRLRLCVHPPEVARWLGRESPVPDEYLSWFVQVRALSHTFARVEFLPSSSAEVELARRVAQQGICEEQPGKDVELLAR